MARSNKETTRQAKTFAVEHEPDLSDSSEKEQNTNTNTNTNTTPPTQAKAEAQVDVEVKSPKKAKAKKEKKEPWPLSRNTNPVSTTGRTHFNIIKRSQWPTGVPSVMGGHVMPSGKVAPVTQSKQRINDVYSAEETQHVHPFHYDGEDLPQERAKLFIYSNKTSLGDQLCADVAAAAREAVKESKDVG